MTIGPAPMINMLLMSVRLGMMSCVRRGFFHQAGETVEQITHVMRPRTCLGMPLKAERGPVGERETLQRAVEERLVRDAHVRGQRRGVHREAVVLAGDHYAPAVEVLHRVVSTVMAKFHFQRLRA